MKWRSFFAPSLVGIDIQPDAVRLVQLKKTKQGLRLLHAASAPLPLQVFVDGKIQCFDSLCTVLSSLTCALDIKGMVGVVTLPAHLVRMQRIQLPKGLDQHAMETEIYAHLERELLGLSEPFWIDYIELTEPSSAHMSVFFAAVREAYLSQYINCVNFSGLKVKIADVDLYAILRMVSFAHPPFLMPHGVNAILHIAKDLASLIVFNAEHIFLHQQWDKLNAADFSIQLKNRLSLCLGTLPIETLALCGEQSYLDLIQQNTHETWPCKLVYPDFTACMMVDACSNTNAFLENPADFLIACGAAMREVPTW